jgi:uncharacterized membrane protein
LKTWNVAAFALNVALYVAAGYLFSSVVPIKFEGVRFWPQVIIPAVFAAVFGPWVGGLGAALGIFLNDIILGNNPLLSLMAGVTSNFAGFWLIGYIVNKRTRWRVSIVASTVVSALLVGIALVYVEPLSLGIILSIAIAASYIVLGVVALSSSKWRSYEVGSVIGVTVPLYSQYFAPETTSITVPLILSTFVFTFSSEIPFLLILGPPIIEAIYRAFPNFKTKEEPREQ